MSCMYTSLLVQHFQLIMQTFVLARFEPSLVFVSQVAVQALVHIYIMLWTLAYMCTCTLYITHVCGTYILYVHASNSFYLPSLDWLQEELSRWCSSSRESKWSCATWVHVCSNCMKCTVWAFSILPVESFPVHEQCFISLPLFDCSWWW